ncbi:hypothetical protein F4801DRAFT_102938 [Xylaria longipes]|nr:hypothetical protein F4801DRAFT_102938 [Xylaria longipes]
MHLAQIPRLAALLLTASRVSSLKVANSLEVLEWTPELIAKEDYFNGSVSIVSGGIPSLASDASVDLGGNSETQLLRQYASHKNLRTVIATAEVYYRIVASRKAGIGTLADLKGKRIGAFPSTSSEYFVQTYLATVGLRPADYTIGKWLSGSIPICVCASGILPNHSRDATTDSGCRSARRCLSTGALRLGHVPRDAQARGHRRDRDVGAERAAGRRSHRGRRGRVRRRPDDVSRDIQPGHDDGEAGGPREAPGDRGVPARAGQGRGGVREGPGQGRGEGRGGGQDERHAVQGGVAGPQVVGEEPAGHARRHGRGGQVRRRHGSEVRDAAGGARRARRHERIGRGAADGVMTWYLECSGLIGGTKPPLKLQLSLFFEAKVDCLPDGDYAIDQLLTTHYSDELDLGELSLHWS